MRKKVLKYGIRFFCPYFILEVFEFEHFFLNIIVKILKILKFKINE